MEVALYQDEKNVSIDIWGRQEARTQETRKKSAGCYWIYCIGHTLEVYSSDKLLLWPDRKASQNACGLIIHIRIF